VLGKFIPVVEETIQLAVILIIPVPDPQKDVPILHPIPNRIQREDLVTIRGIGHIVLQEHHQVQARGLILLPAVREVLLVPQIVVRPVVQPERILLRVVRPARQAIHEALRVVPLVPPEAVLLVHQVLLPDLPVEEEVVDSFTSISIISMRS
jgi:hypothetical protein